MAKLTRVIQKIFGSSAAAGQIGVFGSLKAGAPATTTDPTTAQSLSNFLGGWFDAVMGNNSPCIEDMNAIHFVTTRQLAYLFQAGIAEWEAGTTYYIGSFVNDSGKIYKSIVDDNINNAVTDSTKWRLVLGDVLNQKSADYTLTLNDRFVEFDATAGDKTATLPAAASSAGKLLTVTKTDSSANKVIVTDGVFTDWLVAQYDSATYFSNGTVWYKV